MSGLNNKIVAQSPSLIETNLDPSRSRLEMILPQAEADSGSLQDEINAHSSNFLEVLISASQENLGKLMVVVLSAIPLDDNDWNLISDIVCEKMAPNCHLVISGFRSRLLSRA